MNFRLKKCCEEIDAAFFSGDTFFEEESLVEIECYVKRWKREIVNIKKVNAEKEKEWITTDPSSQQQGRQISETVFEFKEYDDFRKCWVNDTIDLDDYTKVEINEFCEGYYSEEDILTLSNWIKAECIFEQTNGLY